MFKKIQGFLALAIVGGLLTGCVSGPINVQVTDPKFNTNIKADTSVKVDSQAATSSKPNPVFAAPLTVAPMVVPQPEENKTPSTPAPALAPRSAATTAPPPNYLPGETPPPAAKPKTNTAAWQGGLNAPQALAIAKDGTIYVADTGNNRVVKMQPDGTLSPYGSPIIHSPRVLQFDKDGQLYTNNDDGVHCTIMRLDLTGVSIVLGRGGEVSTSSVFTLASGVVYTTLGNQIQQTVNNSFTIPLAGSMSTPGYADLKAEAARFSGVRSMVIAADGSIYASDAGNARIRKIDTNGNVTTFAGSGVHGFRDGAAGEARFSGPQGLALAANGDLLVADNLNSVIRRIDSSGNVTTLKSSGLAAPTAVAVAPDGSIYATDERLNQVVKINP